eukprot:3105028-Rhodomonas_salina.1
MQPPLPAYARTLYGLRDPLRHSRYLATGALVVRAGIGVRGVLRGSIGRALRGAHQPPRAPPQARSPPPRSLLPASAAVYGGSAALNRSRAAVYGGDAAVDGGTAGADGGRAAVAKRRLELEELLETVCTESRPP